MTERILVNRLMEIYSPWTALDIPELSLNDVMASSEEHHYVLDTNRRWNSEEEHRSWNLGRIKFFINQILEGIRMDPISVDGDWGFGGYPIIEDGHHRFLASLLTGQTTIEIHFGGREDVLFWLRGEAEMPDDLAGFSPIFRP